MLPITPQGKSCYFNSASRCLIDLPFNDSSCFWQAVASRYGADHPLKDAEAKSLAIRDEALAKIDAYLSTSAT